MATRPQADRSPVAAPEDVALERALEGLFRLTANRRSNARQTAAVGAVVSRAGYAVLRSLSDHGTLTLGQIASACAMDAATASRQLTALVEEGLVERGPSAGDARAVDVTLTAHGREVYARIVTFRLRHLTTVVGEWSTADRATLATLVDRLVSDFTSVPYPSVPRSAH
jgi:DNA-binding MarR family transcriptional regulator